jgi:hypothetical protein
VRVVLGPEVPPLGVPVVGVVLVDVLAGVLAVELVLVVCVLVVPVVWTGGALATETVFVPPPQPLSSAAPASPTSSAGTAGEPRLMTSMVFAALGTPPRFGLCRPRPWKR